jgi:hypothetical protein
MVNDIDGTVNDNGRVRINKNLNIASGFYRDREMAKHKAVAELFKKP